MKKLFILFIILNTLFFGCKNSPQAIDSALKLVKIEIKNAEELDYNKVFKNCIYIPLETQPNSLIGEIGKLYTTESLIIIFDTKQNEILLFDKAGKFLRKIGKKGSGPDEYAFFNDIFFEKNTAMIHAHERYLNKIFTYDLSGDLVNQTPVSKHQFNSFCKTAEGFWVYSCFKGENNPEGYNLMLLDETLQKVKASYFPQKEFVNATFGSTFTCNENGIPYFIFPTSNIVYQLTKESAHPYCEIDFGSHSMPYEKIAQISDMNTYDKLISDKRYLGDINNFFMNSGKFYFSFSETGLNIQAKSYNCYYNTLTSELHIYENPFMGSTSYPVFTKLLGIENLSLIYSIIPYILTEDSYSKLSKDLGCNISAESNPILVLLELK